MSALKLDSYTVTDTGLEVAPSVVAAKVIHSPATTLKTLAVLFKLRVVVLLLFAAVGGAFLGAGGWPGASTLALLLTGGLAASES